MCRTKFLLLWSFLLLFLDQAIAQEESLNAPPNPDWYNASYWTMANGGDPTGSWKFREGQIRLAKPKGGGHLISQPLPPSFKLSFRFKYDEKANSGVKYRVRRFGNRWLGIEYQIIDEKPDASPNKNSTASFYDLFSASENRRLLPSGEWNEATIVASNWDLEHYLNGELVNTATVANPGWDAAIAKSKFYGEELFGHPLEGDRIMLTDHGGRVSYRDFQLVKLDSANDTASLAAAPHLGNAFRNSWADQTSIVLWTRTTAQAEMTEGPNFLTLNNNLGSKYPDEWSEEDLLSSQLPEGKELNAMLGACPGAAGEVRLAYFPVGKRKAIVLTDWVTTDAANDFATQWKLDGLTPGTAYAAIVEARPVGVKELTAVVRGGFKTAPAVDDKAEINFCMTTCHDFERRDDGLLGHKIYPSMTALEPNFVVHAGDIEYYDKPHPWAWTVELMRFKWARLFSLPRNRTFYANTSTYFIKDDHDTLKNDCWAGQTYGAVSFERGMKIFNEEQFPSHPTRYETVSWGKDLQIWILEGRDYRSANNAPDGPSKSILGEEQKAWLFETLKASNAKFKLIFSPTPIVGPDRKNKKDNHANRIFEYEGNLLRDYFATIDGLIVFCGDRHWQYASVDAKTGVWEFGCGPGSEKHQLGWKAGDVRPVHQFLRVAGGFLSGNLSYENDEPKLTLRHHAVTGEEKSSFEFPIVGAN